MHLPHPSRIGFTSFITRHNECQRAPGVKRESCFSAFKHCPTPKKNMFDDYESEEDDDFVPEDVGKKKKKKKKGKKGGKGRTNNRENEENTL